MSHVVLYSFGLGTLSTVRLSETIKACSFSYQYRIFSGASFSFADGCLKDASPEQVYRNVCSIAGSKIVVLLYLQDGTESDERMPAFLGRLAQLFSPASNTKVCICFPIPNQASRKGTNDARNLAIKLVELAQHSRGRLKTLELYPIYHDDPVIRIPGISYQTPHITQGGSYQLASLIVQEIADKLKRRSR
jgi:hypothetical protein